MIDPSESLKTALITLLDGTITYNGTPVPAFSDSLPPGDFQMYILLSQFDNGDFSAKNCFVSDLSGLIIPVVKTAHTHTDTTALEYISRQICALVQPTPGSSITLSGFTNIVVYLESSITDTSLLDAERTIRKLMRWRFKVE